MACSAGRGHDAFDLVRSRPCDDSVSHEKILYSKLSKWDKFILEKENEAEKTNNEPRTTFCPNKSKQQFSLSWCLLKKLRTVRVRKAGVNSNIGLTEVDYGQRQSKNKTKWQQRRHPEVNKFEQVERLQSGQTHCEGQSNSCEQSERLDKRTWQEPERQPKKRRLDGQQSHIPEQAECAELRPPGWQPERRARLHSHRSLYPAHVTQEARWRPVAPAASCCAKPAPTRVRNRLRHSLRDSNCHTREKQNMAGLRLKELPVEMRPTRDTSAVRNYYDSLQYHDIKTNGMKAHHSNAEMQADGERMTLIAAPATTMMAQLWVAAATDSTRPATEFTTSGVSTAPSASKTSTVPAELKSSASAGTTVVYETSGINSPRVRARSPKEEPTLSAASTLSSGNNTLSESSSLSYSSGDVDPGAPSYVPANDRAYWFFRNRRTLGVQTARQGCAPGRGETFTRAGHVVGGGRLSICPQDPDAPAPMRPPLLVTVVARTGHCVSELQKKLFSQNPRVEDKTRSQYTQYDKKDMERDDKYKGQVNVYPFTTSQFRVTNVTITEQREGDAREHAQAHLIPVAPPSPTAHPCDCELMEKGTSCLRADAALSTTQLNQRKKNTIPKKKLPIWKRYLRCFQKKQAICTCLSKKKQGLRCLSCKNNLECECTGNVECKDCKQTHEFHDPFHDPNFIKIIQDDVSYRNALQNKTHFLRGTNTYIKEYESDKSTHHQTGRVSTPLRCYWHKGDPNAKCLLCKVPSSKLDSKLPCVCKYLNPLEQQSQSQSIITDESKPCGWKYRTEDGTMCLACYKPICKCQCKARRKTGFLTQKKGKKTSIISQNDILQNKRADVAESNKQMHLDNIDMEINAQELGARNKFDKASSSINTHDLRDVNQDNIQNNQMARQDSLELRGKTIMASPSDHDKSQQGDVCAQTSLNSALPKSRVDKHLKNLDMETQSLDPKTKPLNTLEKASSPISIHDTWKYSQNTTEKSPSTSEQQQKISSQDSLELRQNAIASLSGNDKYQSSYIDSQKPLRYSTATGRATGWPSSFSNDDKTKPLHKNMDVLNKIGQPSSQMSVHNSKNMYQDTTGKSSPTYDQQQHFGVKQNKQMTRQNSSGSKSKAIKTSPSRKDDVQKELDASSSKSCIEGFSVDGCKSTTNIDKDNLKPLSMDKGTCCRKIFKNGKSSTNIDKNNLKSLSKDEGTCCRTIFKQVKDQGTCCQSSKDPLNDIPSLQNNEDNLKSLSKDEGTCCRTIFKKVRDQGTCRQSSKDLVNNIFSHQYLDDDKCCRIGKLAEFKSISKSQSKRNKNEIFNKISPKAHHSAEHNDEALAGRQKKTQSDQNISLLSTEDQKMKGSHRAGIRLQSDNDTLNYINAQKNMTDSKNMINTSSVDKNEQKSDDNKTYQKKEELVQKQKNIHSAQNVPSFSTKDQNMTDSNKAGNFSPPESNKLNFINTGNDIVYKTKTVETESDKSEHRINKTPEIKTFRKKEVLLHKSSTTSSKSIDFSMKSPSQFSTAKAIDKNDKKKQFHKINQTIPKYSPKYGLKQYPGNNPGNLNIVEEERKAYLKSENENIKEKYVDDNSNVNKYVKGNNQMDKSVISTSLTSDKDKHIHKDIVTQDKSQSLSPHKNRNISNMKSKHEQVDKYTLVSDNVVDSTEANNETHKSYDFVENLTKPLIKNKNNLALNEKEATKKRSQAPHEISNITTMYKEKQSSERKPNSNALHEDNNMTVGRKSVTSYINNKNTHKDYVRDSINYIKNINKGVNTESFNSKQDNILCQCDKDIKILNRPLNRTFQESGKIDATTSTTASTNSKNKQFNKVNQGTIPKYSPHHDSKLYHDNEANNNLLNRDYLEDKSCYIKSITRNNDDIIRTVSKSDQNNCSIYESVNTTNDKNMHASTDKIQNNKNMNDIKKMNGFNVDGISLGKASIDIKVSKTNSKDEGINKNKIVGSKAQDSSDKSKDFNNASSAKRLYEKKHISSLGPKYFDREKLKKQRTQDNIGMTDHHSINNLLSKEILKTPTPESIVSKDIGITTSLLKKDKNRLLDTEQTTRQNSSRPLKEIMTSSLKNYRNKKNGCCLSQKVLDLSLSKSFTDTYPENKGMKTNPLFESMKAENPVDGVSSVGKANNKLELTLEKLGTRDNDLKTKTEDNLTSEGKGSTTSLLKKEKYDKSVNKEKSKLELTLDKLGTRNKVPEKTVLKNNNKEHFDKTHTKTSSMNTVSSITIETKTENCLLGCNYDVKVKRGKVLDLIRNDNPEYSLKSKNEEIRRVDEIDMITKSYNKIKDVKNTVEITTSPHNGINTFFDDIIVLKKPSHNQSNHSLVEYSTPSNVNQVEYFDEITEKKRKLNKKRGLIQDNAPKFSSVVTADENIHTGSSRRNMRVKKIPFEETALKSNKINEKNNNNQEYFAYIGNSNKKKESLQRIIPKKQLDYKNSSESDTLHDNNIKKKTNRVQTDNSSNNFIAKIFQREETVKLRAIKKCMQHSVAADTSLLSSNIKTQVFSLLENTVHKNNQKSKDTKSYLYKSRGTSCKCSHVIEKLELYHRSKINQIFNSIDTKRNFLAKSRLGGVTVFSNTHNVAMQSPSSISEKQMFDDNGLFSTNKCSNPNGTSYCYTSKSPPVQNFTHGKKECFKYDIDHPAEERISKVYFFDSSESSSLGGVITGAASLSRQRPGRHRLLAVTEARTSRVRY